MNAARDRFIARVQAALTFVLVGSFVFLLVRGPTDAATALKDFTGMAVMFWLMRQRPQSPAEEPTDAAPRAKPE